MREGLKFFWMASVIASAFSWLYQTLVRNSGNRFRGRRQVTGCELARQVLDRARLNRTAVASARGPMRGHLGFSLDGLRLPEKVYYGTQLSDSAQALHETAHQLEASQSVIPRALCAPGGWILQAVVMASWFLVLAGFLGPAWRGAGLFGQVLFLIGFCIAVTSLPRERTVTRCALSNLAALEGFGPDEKIRMKKILKALRWSPLTEAFSAPWNWISKGVSFGVSESERIR